MGRVFRAGHACVRYLKGSRLVQSRPLCTNNNSNKAPASVRDIDAYRQLEKLDFMTAAKILFTTPPKKKQFGIDFHLVQLFFACMPSLAVYLVAQYARYEIRRMEAVMKTFCLCFDDSVTKTPYQEVELKKKQSEEEKAKEMESNAADETGGGSDLELLKVKVRLEALEEAVKGIVVEPKKLSSGDLIKNGEEGSKREHPATIGSNTQSRSEGSSAAADDHSSRLNSGDSTPGLNQKRVNGSGPVIDASQHDQEGKAENGEPSQELKK
ncbi:hypothetical protein HHK36_021312 [Tetracentron sinense]|uniref:Uncharacterized protein n=1 Tax=Tetracentron sinense TaxID=13715 RepID=A0A834YTM0_TETSI|nr:hypothetical protein HHK36_021312 [Tetracentron sinense]